VNVRLDELDRAVSGACSRESLFTLSVSPWVSAMMIEKVIVVAPTTAVPISTGFAVALKVLPAPSLASSKCFARSNFASML
jgi:hypothetical protein